MMPKILIAYDGENTGTMAKAIASGASTIKELDVIVKNVNEIKMEDFENADAVLLGSPTINKNISSKMRALLQQIKDLPLQGKIGAAFGSYGWSGEAPSLLMNALSQFRMNLHYPVLRVKREPSEKDLEDCRGWGKAIAEKTMNHN